MAQISCWVCSYEHIKTAGRPGTLLSIILETSRAPPLPPRPGGGGKKIRDREALLLWEVQGQLTCHRRGQHEKTTQRANKLVCCPRRVVFVSPTGMCTDLHGSWNKLKVEGADVLQLGFNWRGSKGHDHWLALTTPAGRQTQIIMSTNKRA